MEDIINMNYLIDKCLYNWLGYGNIDGDIWFIGTEEGGAEIWRDKLSTLTLEESLERRSKFPLACSFNTVWEEIYGIPLNKFRGITTWHFMSAFLLAIESKNEVSGSAVREFIFDEKNLGDLDGNHFMCELFPLPKKSKRESDFAYKGRWENSIEYKNEVVEKRFSMIADAISKSLGAKLIIVYDKDASNLIIDKWGNSTKDPVVFQYSNEGKRIQKYTLHFTSVAGKDVVFLFTPFFGNGLISYEGILKVVEMLKEASYI